MFNKLKNKFLITNMFFTTLVMLLSFVTIFLITKNNISLQNETRISNLSLFDTFFIVDIPNPGEIVSNSSFFEINTIENVINALPTNINTVVIEDRTWLFKELPHNFTHTELTSNSQETSFVMITEVIANTTSIVFLDITESLTILNDLIFIMFIIGSIVTFFIYLISNMFAKKAIMPIEESYQRQKRFIADSSHELKTPLAIINATVDAINEELEVTMVTNIKTQVKRINNLIESMLVLTKSDFKENNNNLQKVNISTLISEELLNIEVIAFEKNKIIKSSITENIIIKSDKTKLSQVIIILFDNAIKYSATKNISIILEKQRKGVFFAVKNDHDSNISERNVQKIFDRFYRGNETRTHDGSYGLGLSIAKEIIESIGGNMYAKISDTNKIEIGFWM